MGTGGASLSTPLVAPDPAVRRGHVLSGENGVAGAGVTRLRDGARNLPKETLPPARHPGAEVGREEFRCR
jgi:hypothetical protein